MAIDDSDKFCANCGIDQAQFVASPSPGLTPPDVSSPARPERDSIFKSPWRTAAGHRRSVAWIYYALIACVALILGLHHSSFVVVAIVAGLYSTYLFRGGRFVIWFW